MWSSRHVPREPVHVQTRLCVPRISYIVYAGVVHKIGLSPESKPGETQPAIRSIRRRVTPRQALRLDREKFRGMGHRLRHLQLDQLLRGLPTRPLRRPDQCFEPCMQRLLSLSLPVILSCGGSTPVLSSGTLPSTSSIAAGRPVRSPGLVGPFVRRQLVSVDQHDRRLVQSLNRVANDPCPLPHLPCLC
jgi:hypothetical protein